MIYTSMYYLPIAAVAFYLYWYYFEQTTPRIILLIISSISIILLSQSEGDAIFELNNRRLILHSAELVALGLLSFTIYHGGKSIIKSPAKYKILFFIFISLLPLLFFKYFGPILYKSGNLAFIPVFIVPLGLSYYSFKNISYIIDCSQGRVERPGFLSYLLYIAYFPMFVAGPIERFGAFAGQLIPKKLDHQSISTGMERIFIGMFQKYVIADLLLRALYPAASELDNVLDNISTSGLLFLSFMRFLIGYFDFAGYTSMAIGTSLLFGIKLCENFNFPLLRPNLADFWRSWHMSLSGWARDYIYFPILNSWNAPNIAILATMLTIGVWHAATPGWIMWGIHHGVGLILLAYFQRLGKVFHSVQLVRSTRIWWLASLILTWLYVSIGFSLTLNSDSFFTSISLYLKLMTFGLVDLAR